MKATTAAVPVSRPLPMNLPHPLISEPSSPPHPLTSPLPSPPHPLTSPPPSPHHPLPTATETSGTSQSGEEEGGDGVDRAHIPAPTVSIATQTRGSVENTDMTRSTSEQEDTPAGGQTAPDPSSGALPRDWARGENSLPPAHESPPTREALGERAEEVRREVLASLYRRYLRELRATRKPAKKTDSSPAARAGGRSQQRGEHRQLRLNTKHGRKLEDKEKSKREERGREEERQTPPGNLCTEALLR